MSSWKPQMLSLCSNSTGRTIFFQFSLGIFVLQHILFTLNSLKNYLHLYGYRLEKFMELRSNKKIKPCLVVHFILFECHGTHLAWAWPRRILIARNPTYRWAAIVFSRYWRPTGISLSFPSEKSGFRYFT